MLALLGKTRGTSTTDSDTQVGTALRMQLRYFSIRLRIFETGSIKLNYRQICKDLARGSQFLGGQTTMGVPTHCGGRQTSQQCHKYFLQFSTFASKRPQVRTRGHQTCFLPRAPSNFVTPLTIRTMELQQYLRN